MGYVKPSILRLILTVFLSAGLFAQDQTLYILHTNNTNGALENCYCPDHPFGSVEKRTIFVKDFINEHPNTVLVDAGDFFTMTHQSYKDSLMAEAYALLPYDAILPGDQELTMDGDKIDPLLGLMNTKIVGTNITMDGVNSLVSSHLVDRGGFSIAIMGIMDPYAVKYYSEELKEKIELSDPVKAVEAEMEILKDKADIFILLTHQGADLDEAFAEKVKGLHVIVGSHSQSTMDEPKEVNGTLIVQAGKEGYYVGTVALILNKETIEAKSGRIDTMTFDMPDDDRVMEMIHEYESKTGKINIEILASNPVYMAVAVVLAIIILLGIIKKLIKLVMVVSAILVLWVAYMVYTGQEVNIESAQKSYETAKETVIEAVSTAGEKAKKSAGEKMEEKAKENLDKLLPKKD